MRRKKAFLAKISQRLDIPSEALPFGFGLSLSGRDAMTVHGCREILVYEKECIRLSVGKEALCVLGEALDCTAMEAGNLTVEGRIRSICFEEETGFEN